MECPLTAVLLSRDAQSLCTIDKTFNEFNIEADLCLSADSGRTAMDQGKFDLLVLDFDMPGAIELIEFQEGGQRIPKTTIALAHDAGLLKQALSKRVHFVVQKPFTADLMGKTLKAAYSLLVREKRKAFRHSVKIHAVASYDESGTKRTIHGAVVQDISETGLLLKSGTEVPKFAVVHVNFELPETPGQIHTTGRSVWGDTNGQMGIQFNFIPPQEEKVLQQWLRARCPWDVELTSKTMPVRPPDTTALHTAL